MKKVWQGAAAAIAAISLGVTGFVGATSAYAVDTPGTTTGTTVDQTKGSITITDDATTARTYNAYQIFAGGYNNGTLSNVTWGNGITPAGQTALTNEVRTQVTTFNATAADDKKINLPANPTAAEVAEAIADLGLATNSAGAKALANVFKAAGTLSNSKTAVPRVGVTSTYKVENIATGYYLISDETDGLTGHEAKTSFLLQVVGNATAAPKRQVPTVTKQVEDENNTDGNKPVWGNSADHAIGEEFRFKLNANVPANTNLADYATYKLVFNDSMSTGLTWNSIDSVTVTPTGADPITIPAKNGNQAGYELSSNAVTDATGPLTWDLTIANIRNFLTDAQFVGGFKVTVIYNAELNADAYVNDADGTTTNKNDVDLSFSNNPNVDTEMGKTPKDEVYIFTFKVDAQKVDGNDQALEGAGFTIYKGTKADTNKLSFVWNETKKAYVLSDATAAGAMTEIFSKDEGNFSFQGLEEGTYIIEESTTPAGYNTAADTTITISATHDKNNVDITSIEDDKTVSVKVINNAGSNLPSTGGMGTTVLYAAGAAIVLIAGIGLAVALRRRQA